MLRLGNQPSATSEDIWIWRRKEIAFPISETMITALITIEIAAATPKARLITASRRRRADPPRRSAAVTDGAIDATSGPPRADQAPSAAAQVERDFSRRAEGIAT